MSISIEDPDCIFTTTYTRGNLRCRGIIHFSDRREGRQVKRKRGNKERENVLEITINIEYQIIWKMDYAQIARSGIDGGTEKRRKDGRRRSAVVCFRKTRGNVEVREVICVEVGWRIQLTGRSMTWSDRILAVREAKPAGRARCVWCKDRTANW